MKQRAWALKRSVRLITLQQDSKLKGEDTTNIRKEEGITADQADIKMTVDYSKQLYTQTFDNSGEMDQFSKNTNHHTHPIWNNLNSPITIK